MGREIRKVRKAIKMRKKEHEKLATRNEGRLISNFPTDEERFGFYPDFYDITGQPLHKIKKESIPYPFILKIASAVFLFFSTYVLFKQEHSVLEQPKQWLRASLTEEFPFAKVHHWYVTTFDETVDFNFLNGQTVPAQTNEHSLPVSGEVVETFAHNGTGIRISTEQRTDVTALDAGIVIFAGNDRHTKKTITLQHADGTMTTYGFLHTIDVHPYQSVVAQEKMGSFLPTNDSETFYFAIEKENEFIDPQKVIPAYELP